MKNFEFINEAAKKAYKALPSKIQFQFGTDLNAVQHDKDRFSEYKVLTERVGAGAIELIESGSPAYRAVYCCNYQNTVYVLHAFEKTTNGVDKQGMATAKLRYKLMKAKVEAENRAAARATPNGKRKK